MVDQAKLNALNKSMMDPSKVTFKGLIYGDPGTRKTTLGASIGEKVLFVVADPDGYQSLINHPELGLGTRVELVKYQGIAQLEFLAEVFTDGGTEYDRFDTIQLDTLSNIASLDLDVVTREKMKKKGDSFEWEDQQWPIYNQNTLRVRSALLKLMLSPINVVMTAHAREKKIKQSTGVERDVTMPKFSPEIFASISGFCSLIAYMTTSEGGVDSNDTVRYKSKIQYHPTRTIVAKTRIGGLPVSEDLPDNSSDVLNGSRLRQIVEAWKQKGGALLSHEKAEEEQPEEQGINIPVLNKNTEDSDPQDEILEQFSI